MITPSLARRSRLGVRFLPAPWGRQLNMLGSISSAMKKMILGLFGISVILLPVFFVWVQKEAIKINPETNRIDLRKFIDIHIYNYWITFQKSVFQKSK
jgi:hypothetical protein